MITASNQLLGTFKLVHANMGAGDVFNTKLINPLPEQHLNQASMVISGVLQISVGEYITEVNVGENAKVTPRAGQSPFPVGTIVSIVAVQQTRYTCVTNEAGGVLLFEAAISQGDMPLAAGTIVIPTSNYTLNGTPYLAGNALLAAEGDVINAPVGTKIGIFTPT